VLSLAVSPRFSDDQTLLAALAEGLFRSSDAGSSWTPIGPEDLKDPRMVAYSRDTGGNHLVLGLASGKKAYISENGGGIWRELSGPFGDEELVGIALSPNYTVDHTLLLASFSATPPCGATGSGHRARDSRFGPMRRRAPLRCGAASTAGGSGRL
jgi:hypothetical protein